MLDEVRATNMWNSDGAKKTEGECERERFWGYRREKGCLVSSESREGDRERVGLSVY